MCGERSSILHYGPLIETNYLYAPTLNGQSPSASLNKSKPPHSHASLETQILVGVSLLLYSGNIMSGGACHAGIYPNIYWPLFDESISNLDRTFTKSIQNSPEVLGVNCFVLTISSGHCTDSYLNMSKGCICQHLKVWLKIPSTLNSGGSRIWPYGGGG